jgi:hypothetical protein
MDDRRRRGRPPASWSTDPAEGLDFTVDVRIRWLLRALAAVRRPGHRSPRLLRGPRRGGRVRRPEPAEPVGDRTARRSLDVVAAHRPPRPDQVRAGRLLHQRPQARPPGRLGDRRRQGHTGVRRPLRAGARGGRRRRTHRGRLAGLRQLRRHPHRPRHPAHVAVAHRGHPAAARARALGRARLRDPQRGRPAAGTSCAGPPGPDPLDRPVRHHPGLPARRGPDRPAAEHGHPAGRRPDPSAARAAAGPDPVRAAWVAAAGAPQAVRRGADAGSRPSWSAWSRDGLADGGLFNRVADLVAVLPDDARTGSARRPTPRPASTRSWRRRAMCYQDRLARWSSRSAPGGSSLRRAGRPAARAAGREALFHRIAERRFHASLSLALSPYGPRIAAGCAARRACAGRRPVPQLVEKTWCC